VDVDWLRLARLVTPLPESRGHILGVLERLHALRNTEVSMFEAMAYLRSSFAVYFALGVNLESSDRLDWRRYISDRGRAILQTLVTVLKVLVRPLRPPEAEQLRP
jgi:hypothetical protein